MHTENDLRAVLDDWADAAVERTDERPAPRRSRRPARWIAPLAAAAAVAAAAITITAVADRGPGDSPAAKPAASARPTASVMASADVGSQRVAANFRRLLHDSGTITNVHGSSYGKSVDTAFDYDDGHGVTGVQIRLQAPGAKLPSTTGATRDTWRAIYLDLLSGKHIPQSSASSSIGNSTDGWLIGSVQPGGRVVVVGIQNRPNGSGPKTTRTTRLLSDDQLLKVADDKSWASIHG